MTQYRVDFDAIPWQAPLDGVRCKIHIEEGRQLRLVEYSRDMQPHWCDKGHHGYVLDGRMEITIGEDTFTYGPGDGVRLPAGEEHRHMARILTDTVTVFFVEEVNVR